jgi:flagellar hook-associated protein 1 FlgK
LNGILSSALSALQTNQAALNVVSNNIANINTPGYAQRTVNEQPLVTGGQLAGVDIADVQRVVNQFLQQESLYAGAGSAQYTAQTGVYSQLNGLLGQPGDDTSLTSQLDAVSSALGSASLSPSSSTSQQSVVASLQSFASTVSGLSSSISNLQGQVDQQISSSIGTVNGLLSQINSLNQQILSTAASGNSGSSGLLDQRDQAVQSLSQLIGVRVSQQSNGELSISTQDGVNLVGNGTYGQLGYSSGAPAGSYGPITLQTIAVSTDTPIGPAQVLDPHLGSGQLQGLVQMRDGALANFQQEIGNFAQQAELAYNAQSNANAAFPPPQTLSGRNTGLLATDSLGFTGQTTIAVADPNGNLVSRIDVNFSAGTLSVDGGAPASFSDTVGGFVSALNAALGSNGTASFANGQLSISASGSNGIVVQDSQSSPTSRGGTGFSQFFGLNDLFTSSVPSIAATGLSASDAGGFAAGGTMNFVLKGPNGEVGRQASVTLTGGMTIGDIVNALNTSFGGAATFSLGSNGALSMTPSSQFGGYQLNVASDSTQRGSTGMSFTELFGLGSQQAAALASGFSVNSAIAATPALLQSGQPSITASTQAGQQIVGAGDSSGLLALQSVNTGNQTFGAAGGLAAGTMSLDDYAGSFYQDVATSSQAAQSNATTQGDRLTQAQSLQSQVSGVNLDQQLSNMVMYQQAYSAGAHVMQVAQSLYDTLLQIS